MSDKVHEATTTYGKLIEGLHITGYSFERACTNLESLLEKDDWKLGGRFKTINEFLDTINLDKFRAVAEQRKRFAKRIKELQPKASNRQIAKTMGVHHKTIDRDTGAKAPKQSQKSDETGANAPRELSGAQAAKLVQRKETGTADKQERRAEREQELGAKQLALPEKRYGVIYADPPWKFEPYSRETGMDRAADNHYPTESTEVIARMAVPAADDCALFLWATVPMLPAALYVMAKWGFVYQSQFAWIKDKAGTGYWTRNKHELLLIGTRGDIPAPAPGEQYESALTAPLAAHSAKPFEFHGIIEDMFPNLPRIELFAREIVSGWDQWGNELKVAAE